MALIDKSWYCNGGNQTTTGYYAVPVWTTGAKTAGQIVRQVAPALGNERLFVCIIAGSSGAAEPTWVVTRGAKTVDSGVTWQECTGQAALNGDIVNTTTTAQTRSIAAVLGQVIYDVTSGSVQICSTAGNTAAGTPPFGSTAGVTQLDSAATWTCLGVPSAFAKWANPHAKTVNALQTTWGGVAGNTVWVANTHLETFAGTQTWQPSGAFNNPTKVLCVNVAGNVPPVEADLTTGALINSTTSGGLNINTTSLYAYGIEFRLGTINVSANCQPSILNTANAGQIFKNCRFTLGTSFNPGSGGSGYGIGSSGYLEWEDCQIGLNGNNQAILNGAGPCKFVWRNPSGISGVTAVSGGTPIQGYLLATDGQLGGNTQNVDGLIEGVDLSAISLLKAQTVTSGGIILFKDCALHSGITPFVPLRPQGPVVDYMRCDSAGTDYQYMRGRYQGQLFTETSIVRSGGAAIQGTHVSWKIVTSVNAVWVSPFRTSEVIIPNYVVGSSRIVTIYGTINAPGLPNNDEIWVEVCYLGSSSGPVGFIKSSTKASILAANNPVGSDGSSWGGGGSGAGWTPFALAVTLTSPNTAIPGLAYARVCAAKPLTTYYIDPQAVIT